MLSEKIMTLLPRIEEILAESGKVLVVSCESGGAQIISSMLRKTGDSNCFYCLEGPAVNIFRNKLGGLRKAGLDFIGQADLVLTGTSWMPELERRAIAIARDKKKISVSVLDHWTNYIERFLPPTLWKNPPGNWKEYLPDRIACCDRYARKAALRLSFPEEILTEIPNYYLEDIKSDMEKRPRYNPDDFRLLYICEPVRDDLIKTYGDANHWGYDEFTLAAALRDSAEKAAAENKNIKIRFRPHPNEEKNKYDSYITGCPPIHVSPNPDLVDDLAWCSAVLGGESMALVAALYAGKTVYSFLPAGSRKKCALPHDEIRHIDNIDIIFRNIQR